MNNAVVLRLAQAGDEEALALVGQATFLETFAGILDGSGILAHCRNQHASAIYADWLAKPRCALWLAEALPGNGPVGYAVVAPTELAGADPERDLELKRIYLLSRYHGSGIGKQLLDLAVQQAREAGAPRLLLGVYGGNEAAIGFYRKQGFTHFSERKFNVGGKIYDDFVLSLALT
jgi:ribosomal protein S18 acetylase RimI-like enzyme